MLTAQGRALLERWIYVLVMAGEDYLAPYTPARWERVAGHSGYDAGFRPFLERCLEALPRPGWAAGSYFPGGWYRALVARGEDPARATIAPETFAPFFLDEVVVDARGDWFVGGKPIVGRILDHFLRNLHFDAELERYVIRYRLERHVETRYLHHHSPPLRVRRVTLDGAGITLWLNTGERERLHPETLRLDARELLYCAVRAERLPARFEEPARWELLKDVEARDGAWVLHVGGCALETTLEAPWPYADRLPA
jgi:hypothetical protein